MEATKAFGLRGVRVLVVDDDHDSLAFLTCALELYGVELMAVTSVREAQTVFTETRPQLVISDLALPLESGYDFIQWVRSLSPESGGLVPVLLVSAMVYESDKQKALAAGFNVHLSKPVDLDALLPVMLDLLQKP